MQPFPSIRSRRIGSIAIVALIAVVCAGCSTGQTVSPGAISALERQAHIAMRHLAANKRRDDRRGVEYWARQLKYDMELAGARKTASGGTAANGLASKLETFLAGELGGIWEWVGSAIGFVAGG